MKTISAPGAPLIQPINRMEATTAKHMPAMAPVCLRLQREVPLQGGDGADEGNQRDDNFNVIIGKWTEQSIGA